MSFDFHSDVNEHPAFNGEHGLAALGLWTMCGSWTSAHGRTGMVPREVAEDMGDPGLIAVLVDGGLWEETPDGYEMLRGPSTDFPMPLWKYGEKPDDGRLITIDEDSLR